MSRGSAVESDPLTFVSVACALTATAASAQQADLIVNSVDASAVSGNWQSLSIGGTLDVEIQNAGNGATAGAFDAVVFEDQNANGAYDVAVDTLLGSQSIAALGAGAQTAATIAVSGTVGFRGNLIYAFADAANVIAESDEGNNVSSSGAAFSFQPNPGAVAPVLEWSWARRRSSPTRST